MLLLKIGAYKAGIYLLGDWRVLNDREVDRITEFFKMLDMFKGTTDTGDSMGKVMAENV